MRPKSCFGSKSVRGICVDHQKFTNNKLIKDIAKHRSSDKNDDELEVNEIPHTKTNVVEAESDVKLSGFKIGLGAFMKAQVKNEVREEEKKKCASPEPEVDNTKNLV